ncbi:MAG: small ribosomal subunit Rsm22 family protein [Nitrospira sp.]|nr:small ribosomal subunit Rsm22 family protein [Nitrospira sp.]
MLFNNEILQKVLLSYIYGNGRCPLPQELKVIAEGTSMLSKMFTRERTKLSTDYLKDKHLRTAYILYFLQANLYKIHIPLRELSMHPSNLFLKDRLRILDLGSGPGTAILGILDFFAGCAKKPFLEFVAVDSVAENLRDAEGLFRLFKEECYLESSLTTIRSGIERIKKLPDGRFDIMVLSNLLSEVAHNDLERINKRVTILKSLLNDFLHDNGSCIIIEPALRETSREMLRVRDGLLQEGFHIYSPCLHVIDKHCPALDNSKDWCHEDIPWNPPKLITSIDELTGLRKDSIKFSYMVVRKDLHSLADIYPENSYRVVSEPLISKGKKEFYVCGSTGRRLIVRLDKDISPSNNTFEELGRGDIVNLKGLTDEGKRLIVRKETIVRLTAS